MEGRSPRHAAAWGAWASLRDRSDDRLSGRWNAAGGGMHSLGDRILVSLSRPRASRVRDRSQERDQVELLLERRGDALLVVEDEVDTLVKRTAVRDLERAAGRLRTGAADGLRPLALEELRPVPATLGVGAHDKNGQRPGGAIRLAPLASLHPGASHASCGV